MAEEHSPEQTPPGARRADAHPPMPRDKRGWHVAPAPDGRGMPEQAPSKPPPHRRPGFLWFVLILIAVNWIAVLAFRPSTGEPRVTVPFNPFFLQTVESGQVKSISTKGDSVQGTFATKLRYPPNSKTATPSRLRLRERRALARWAPAVAVASDSARARSACRSGSSAAGD